MALVAYYPLNGDAKDYSGNELHGILNAGTFTDGKIGQSYLSDASGEYFYIPAANNNFQDTFNNNFSISFWYYTNIGTENTNRGLLQYGSNGVDNLLHLLLRSSGNYFAIGFYSDDYNSGFVPKLGVWNHYTVVGDKTNFKQKLYINGEFYGERTPNGWLNTPNSNLYIAYYASYPSNGKIDELRIYNHALSEFEIHELALFHPSANLVAHYPLDNDLLDYSGNNLHIDSNTAIYNPNGKIKGSYTYGSGKRSCKTTGFTLGPTSTVAAWGRSSNYSNTMLFSLNVGSGPDLYFTGAICWNMGDGAANPFKDDSGVNLEYPSLNEWHHYAVVTDASKNKTYLYIDGSYKGSAIYRTTEQTNKAFTIGNYIPESTAYSWNGDIDDVRVYSKALSESEIKSLAQGKVAHYKLEDKFEQATQNLFYNKLKPTGTTKVSRLGKLYGWELTGIANDNPRDNLHISSITLEPSTFYTVSAIYYSSSGIVDDFYLQFTDTGWPEGGIYFQPFVNSQASQVNGWSIIKSLGDNWFYLTGTFQTFSTTTAISTIFWDSDTAGQNIFISNLQLEKGKVATPITKNTRQGPVVKDSTYNHNHGSVTLATTPTWSSDTAVGLGSMYFWTPTNNGIENGRKIIVKDMAIPESFSIAFWIKKAYEGYGSSYFRLGGYGYGGIDTYDYNIRLWSTTTSIATLPFNPTTGIWEHYTITYNSSNRLFSLYKNGLLSNSITAIAGTIPSIGDLNIGYGYAGGVHRYFNGWFSDFQIFATALSDEDIYNLYTSKSKSIKFSSSSTSKILQSYNNKTIVPFTTVGTTNWTVPAGVTKIDALIVAGGGGGGKRHGGGGGGGGVLFKKNISVTPGQSIPIVVGGGGLGAGTGSAPTPAQNGGNSSVLSYIAIGGGRGGGYNQNNEGSSGQYFNGGDGGSGGGGATGSGIGGSGTSLQGFNGGSCGIASWPGAGGGGAGGPGENNNGTFGGDGGPGKYIGISFGNTYGENGYVAGGGGGAGQTTGQQGLGGIGGGADGSAENELPNHALPNTGGGGGGVRASTDQSMAGGNGGSGIVLIKYSTSNMNSKITK